MYSVLATRVYQRISKGTKFVPYRLQQNLWVDYRKIWIILKEVGMPQCLILLVYNLYLGQEIVGIENGKT